MTGSCEVDVFSSLVDHNIQAFHGASTRTIAYRPDPIVPQLAEVEDFVMRRLCKWA